MDHGRLCLRLHQVTDSRGLKFYLGCLYKASKAGVEEAGFTIASRLGIYMLEMRSFYNVIVAAEMATILLVDLARRIYYFSYLRDLERKRRFKLKRI